MRAGRTPSRRARRARAALLGVLLAYLAWPGAQPASSVLNSDWPSYATGGTLVLHDPGKLYDRPTQARVENTIVGGKQLANREQGAFLSFDQGPWIAMLASGFVAAGYDLGGRLWTWLEVLAIIAGLGLAGIAARRSEAGRGGPAAAGGSLAAMASTPTALVMFNAQLDGLVVLGLGLAWYLWARSRFLAGLALTLCLAKPQLVLPVAAALVWFRALPVIAGWAAGAAALVGTVVLVHAQWLTEWPGFIVHGAGQLGYELSITGLILRSGLPGPARYGLAAVVGLVAIGLLLRTAQARRREAGVVVGLCVAAGFLVSPHALASDTVLLAFGLAASGRAAGWHWWLLSGLAVAAALLHALPLSSAIGLAAAAMVLYLIARPRPAPVDLPA